MHVGTGLKMPFVLPAPSNLPQKGVWGWGSPPEGCRRGRWAQGLSEMALCRWPPAKPLLWAFHLRCDTTASLPPPRAFPLGRRAGPTSVQRVASPWSLQGHEVVGREPLPSLLLSSPSPLTPAPFAARCRCPYGAALLAPHLFPLAVPSRFLPFPRAFCKPRSRAETRALLAPFPVLSPVWQCQAGSGQRPARCLVIRASR